MFCFHFVFSWTEINPELILEVEARMNRSYVGHPPKLASHTGIRKYMMRNKKQPLETVEETKMFNNYGKIRM